MIWHNCMYRCFSQFSAEYKYSANMLFKYQLLYQVISYLTARFHYWFEATMQKLKIPHDEKLLKLILKSISPHQFWVSGDRGGSRHNIWRFTGEQTIESSVRSCITYTPWALVDRKVTTEFSSNVGFPPYTPPASIFQNRRYPIKCCLIAKVMWH